MKKTETQINIHDFPEELHPYLAGADIFDSSSSPKAKVYLTVHVSTYQAALLSEGWGAGEFDA